MIGSRSAHKVNILHFPRLVSVFKRESEASKATISVINCLENLIVQIILQNLRGNKINQSIAGTSFWQCSKFQLLYIRICGSQLIYPNFFRQGPTDLQLKYDICWNILVKLNIVKLTNSVSMRRCWQGVHRCMVGSRVVVPVLIIHVGIVVVRLVRWWWCARCQYTETRYIYITRYMLE